MCHHSFRENRQVRHGRGAPKQVLGQTENLSRLVFLFFRSSMHADSGQGAFRDCRYAIVVCRQIKPGQRGAKGRGVNPNPWCGILLRAAVAWCSLKWISLAGSGDLSLEFCGNWKRSKKIIESISRESLHCFDALISLIALGKTKKKKVASRWVFSEPESTKASHAERGGGEVKVQRVFTLSRRPGGVAGLRSPPSSCWLSCGSCGGGGKEQHLSLPRRFAFTWFLLIGKLSSFLSPSGKLLPKN